MLDAQSEPCSKDTRAEMTAPLQADSSIHDRLDKSSPLVDQMHIKFANVSYGGSVNFILQYTSDFIVDWVQNFRSGEFGGHSVGEMKSGTFRSCRKATVSRARCASIRRPVERQNPTLGYPE